MVSLTNNSLLLYTTSVKSLKTHTGQCVNILLQNIACLLCLVANCVVDIIGGAVFTDYGSTIRLLDCTLTSNTASQSGALLMI
jgi:hypothetical protein